MPGPAAVAARRGAWPQSEGTATCAHSYVQFGAVATRVAVSSRIAIAGTAAKRQSRVTAGRRRHVNPSGHVGASTALYLAFAILALRIERAWLRWTTIIACLAIPLLVAFARLYRGMHYVTDVAAGIVEGIVCALLAYGWYRIELTMPQSQPRFSSALRATRTDLESGPVSGI